jgi:hypothetical protein
VGSEILAPAARFDANVETALSAVHRAGRVVRGLETAKRKLADEERGMRKVDRKTGVKRGVRISRLLLLAADGSHGFYRQVEKLLLRHGSRVLAVRLDAGAASLGAGLYGSGRTTRLVMIEHKEAVSEVLLSLAEQFGVA